MKNQSTFEDIYIRLDNYDFYLKDDYLKLKYQLLKP